MDNLYLGEPNGELTLSEMSQIIKRMSELFYTGKFSDVEKFLMALDLGTISPDGITTIYRSSYPAREHFSDWDAIVAKFDPVA